jgi:mRNA-degrading endonuclease YafQ of YafQ-DinJ toxin-antitoxin module
LRKIKVTDNYKNDLKRIRKRGWNEKSLTKIIKALQRGGKIPAKLNDHPLTIYLNKNRNTFQYILYLLNEIRTLPGVPYTCRSDPFLLQ